MKLIFFLFIISLSSFASSSNDPTDEVLLKERNSESGISDANYKTSDDSQRLTAIYRVNTDTSKLSSIAAYEFGYAKKLDIIWLEFFYARTTGRFDAIGTNNTNIINTSDETHEASQVTLNTMGTGFSYRSTIIQILLGDIIDTERVFEATSAALTYNSFTDSYYEKSFKGFGMRADYGIHYRINPSVHWGPRFSYNLAVVKKDASDDLHTNSSARSLVLSWTTWGVDLSIYF